MLTNHERGDRMGKLFLKYESEMEIEEVLTDNCLSLKPSTNDCDGSKYAYFGLSNGQFICGLAGGTHPLIDYKVSRKEFDEAYMSKPIMLVTESTDNLASMKPVIGYAAGSQPGEVGLMHCDFDSETGINRVSVKFLD